MRVYDNTSSAAYYSRPLLFYALSAIFSWSFWLAAGYLSRLEAASEYTAALTSLLGFMGLASPLALAAWLIVRNPVIRRDVRGRICNLSAVKPLYTLTAFLLMPASILLAMTLSLLLGRSSSQFAITGQYSFSSGVFPVWFLLIVAPLLEELAWHTYGTDALRTRFSLLATSLVFAMFWGLWHLPLAGIKGYYLSNTMQQGWIYGANFLVSIFPFVIIMNWLYYKSGRNILLPIALHVGAGFFNEVFAVHPDSKVIQTGLLSLLAAALVLRERQFFMTRSLMGLWKDGKNT